MPASAGRLASGSHAERVQRERHEVVLADEHAHLDELLLVEPAGQRRPGGVADAVVGVELVGGPEQRGVVVRPAGGVGAGGDAVDLLLGEAGPQADERRAGRTRRPSWQFHAGPQDQELALPGRQPAGVEQDAAEVRPLLEDLGVPRQRREDVQLPAVGGPEQREHLLDPRVALLGRQRGDAGCGHRAILPDLPRARRGGGGQNGG